MKNKNPVERALALKSPCKDCPFRNDIRPYLTKGRVEELQQALTRQGLNFSCHKTVDYGGDEPNTELSSNCAGSMILLKKIGCETASMQFAERMGLHDFSTLKMDAPVFDTFEEMVDAQDA